MGRFFSSVQIKVNCGRKQFEKHLCEAIGMRGLVPCSEDDATFTYALAFSDSGEWATLACSEYNNNPVYPRDDAKRSAKLMNTSSFSMDVCDSDWAYIELYRSDDSLEKVEVGRSELSDEPHRGSRECWEPLLASGAKWDELNEVFQRDETFVEDALSAAAPLLGIDEKYIISEFSDLASAADNDTNVSLIFFKDKKNFSLKNAFKLVFGEYLEPMGFKMIKGKQPYFVRLIGDEIIHVITYVDETRGYPGQKEFNILGGIATVYRKSIDLSVSPKSNIEWLSSIANFYSMPIYPDADRNYYSSINRFSYLTDSESSLTDVLQYALELVQEFMLPIMDKTISLDECINFFRTFRLSCSTLVFRQDFGNGNPNNMHDEGLLYIQTDYKQLKEKWESVLNKTLIVDDERYERIENLYKYFADSDLHGKALAELKKRKETNLEKLRSYGLEL